MCIIQKFQSLTFPCLAMLCLTLPSLHWHCIFLSCWWDEDPCSSRPWDFNIMPYSSCLLLLAGIFYMEYLQWDLALDLARMAAKHKLLPALSIFTCIHHPFTSEASSQVCSGLHVIFKSPWGLVLSDHWCCINVYYQYFSHRNIWPSECAFKQQTGWPR